MPIFAVIIARIIASILGCELRGGSLIYGDAFTPCMVMGEDIGPSLYQRAFLGWYGLISLPIAALGAGIMVTLGIIAFCERPRD